MKSDINSRIIPWKDLRGILNTVEKPGRYVGGEYGAVNYPPAADDYGICVVFPDLYEIAMSNQAVRILYRMFNDSPGFHAERAFSAAPDFADELKKSGQLLFSLENGIAVRDFDLLAVTIGFELSFTNLLSFLESSGIPLKSEDRGEDHPIVLAGGPAITNPAPWADFLDGIFIGEAEDGVMEILGAQKEIRDRGGSRQEQIGALEDDPRIWSSSSPAAVRSRWMGFGSESGKPSALPVPSMIPVQDHGVVEIMRGCPNKCRFCHAGVFYRPFRQKSVDRILFEVEYLVDKCGYRDITLSSLSTGDYAALEPLVDVLNRKYRHRKVSFSLPSLRVNSITLSLIGSLGEVRKSGLTFAVETPTIEGQKGINKEVPADRVVSILNEAREKGWKLAKFYFMLGLPVAGQSDAEQEIVDYLQGIQNETGMKLNVNLGTFIPKPHTPFERSAQLTDEDAMERIRNIRDGLRSNNKIRFSFHSPYVSYLEGILTRGDSRAGDLALRAWELGAGFDAWDDRMDKDAWRNAISEADWDVEEEICRSRGADEALPWNGVDLGISRKHLEKESVRGSESRLTVPCAYPCTDHCGVCDSKCHTVSAVSPDTQDFEAGADNDTEPDWKRLLLRFGKSGPAVFLGHLDIMSVFEKAIQRAGITVDFTRGFNPKPRIEFAQPLSLGLESTGEIATIRIADTGGKSDDIRIQLQAAMPSGLSILDASWIGPVPQGKKTIKVMGAFWGSDWILTRDGEKEGIPDSRSLADAVINVCNENGIPGDCEITALEDADTMKIRLRHGGTRHHNLMRILESALGEPVLNTPWSVQREISLAIGPEGKPVDYRTAFPE